MIKEYSKNVTKKFSQSEKKEISKAVEKLQTLIDTQAQYGVQFEKIFNNEVIKYDILGDNFYTFKGQGRDKSQIRILYRFLRKDSETYDLELHMVYIKRRTDKSYIREFENYVARYA